MLGKFISFLMCHHVPCLFQRRRKRKKQEQVKQNESTERVMNIFFLQIIITIIVIDFEIAIFLTPLFTGFENILRLLSINTGVSFKRCCLYC